MKADELEKLLEAATKGPWETDSQRNEDCSPKYHDYFIGADVDGKWATLFDSVNSDHKLIEEEFDEDYHHAWDAIAKANAALIVALVNAAPDMIAAMRRVEDLEAENSALKMKFSQCRDVNEGMGAEIDDYEKRVEKLEAILENVLDEGGSFESDGQARDAARAALGDTQS